MFDQFVEWERNRHDYARAWKERTGGKVLGCHFAIELTFLEGRKKIDGIDVQSVLTF